MTTSSKTVKLIHEAGYAAEVEVTLIEEEHEWAPYLAPADIRRLDDVRLALRRGDLRAASKLARIYELKPIAAA